jgi:hypothetical protein
MIYKRAGSKYLGQPLLQLGHPPLLLLGLACQQPLQFRTQGRSRFLAPGRLQRLEHRLKRSSLPSADSGA